jgi:hypothetical protein
MVKIPTMLQIEQLDLFARETPPAPEPKLMPQNGRGPRHQPKGDVYDLDRFFVILNQTVFKNALAPSILRWSRNRWQLTMGLCDVKRRVITMNCALDDARVPEMVVASIMHHEMLHLYIGVSEGPKGTQRFHTPQFRSAERIFPGHAETEKWLAETWPLRGRPAKKQKPEENGFLAYLSLMYP